MILVMKARKISLSIILFITAIATTLILSMIPSVSQANSSERVSFSCQNIFDRASQENLPTTVAWIPEQKKHRQIIIWKSNYFRGWDTRRRCKIVSPKFQRFYEQGTLNYLTNGRVEGNPVICAVATEGDKCNQDNQLFQLKDKRSSETVIVDLFRILIGDARGPIYQSSGRKIYVSMQKLLSKAPIVEPKRRGRVSPP
jgi:hypothetical protein